MSPNELAQQQTQTPDGVASGLPEVDSTLKVLIDLEHRVESMRSTVAEIEHRERRLVEQEAQAQAALADAEKRRVDAEARVRETESRRAEFEEKTKALEGRDRALSDRERIIEERERAAATNAGTSTEIEAEINRLRADATAAREEADWTGAALADVQKQLAEARNARGAVETELKALKAQQPTPLARADLFNRARRTRLASVRRRLKDDAKKLEQISRVLGERQAKVAAAEKMVTLQKSSLLEAEGAREAAEKARHESMAMLSAARRVQERYEKRGAAATSATFIASSVVALAVVAVGAWIGVNRVTQPICRATSTLSMSPSADVLGEDAASTWEGFVAGLPEDPRFLEYAAARYKARGVKELDSPVAVGVMIEDSMTMETVGPGRIVSTLVGPGAGHTAQTLSTLATSIATYANETRDMRADGATTASDTAPASQAEVVEDPRMAMFGMVGGIGAGIVMVGLVVVWRSLRGAVVRAVRETAEALPVPMLQGAQPAPAPIAPDPPGTRKTTDGEIRRTNFRS